MKLQSSFLAFGCFLLNIISVSAAYGADTQSSTAWHDGRFNINVSGVVSRSDIILQKPNKHREEALPLGNGRLGVSVWSENGLTLQLNRADTLPGRLSPGQVMLPGLKQLTDATDYAGRLDLNRGEFIEHGGGLTAVVYVQQGSDTAVLEVTGADPNSEQTASLYLWMPRSASALAQGKIALLSETWKDSAEAGASGKVFGSLAAMTADARDVHAMTDGPLSVKLSFRPKADGSFRLMIAAPEWDGGDAPSAARQAVAKALRAKSLETENWWKSFWEHAGLMKLSSEDGSAEYFENLRLIDLYTAAAESQGPLPGSQAGIGDLFSSMRDEHKWGPSAYWHWNLRMQVAANLGAGLFRFNEPYFRLYRDNLRNIEAWTKAQMRGRAGACVPETLRFNGAGYENETWLKAPGVNCTAESQPYYNARTISTGAEVSLWIWQQYLATQSKAFLIANYPVMAESARFLLAYATAGPDGRIHTFPSNAHETQWDVHDPTTDIAAMKTLFPAVIEAAHILERDAGLARQLKAMIPKLPNFEVLGGTPDSQLIAQSYDNNAPIRNTENIGLEPVWPYSLVGDAGPLHEIALHTYNQRPNKFDDDWSFDPIQAARLGLAGEFKAALLALTEKYQEYPSGFAKFAGPEFYVEQIGVVAAGLQEALVQDYDGLVRIAPAWPKDWDADGAVYIQANSKVDVQMRGGQAVTVIIEAGSDSHIRLRSPWPGKSLEAVSRSGRTALKGGNGSADVFDLPVEGGHSYLIQPIGSPHADLPYAAVDGSPAARPKSLGSRHIGLPNP